MGLFDNIRSIWNSSSDPDTAMDWKQVLREEDVDELLDRSAEKAQILYKHSNRCATCFFAKKNIENIGSELKNKAEYHLIDVIGQRSLSLHIQDKLGIQHESPQMFIIDKGQVVWSGSHHQVTAEPIKTHLL